MKHSLIQKERNKKKHSALVETSDDFYPNFDGPKGYVYVELTFHPKEKKPKFYEKSYSFISVWGDDDFGMEKENGTEEEFNELRQIIITKEDLKKRGFVLS